MIAIKGMEMPVDCFKCRFELRGWCTACEGNLPKVQSLGRPDWCPLVEADPVKHERWLRTDAYPHRIYCSECYSTFIRNDEFLHLEDIPHNYCPNCGAKMDEVEE